MLSIQSIFCIELADKVDDLSGCRTDENLSSNAPERDFQYFAWLVHGK